MTGFPVERCLQDCGRSFAIFCRQTILQGVRIHDAALQASKSSITPTEGAWFSVCAWCISKALCSFVASALCFLMLFASFCIPPSLSLSLFLSLSFSPKVGCGSNLIIAHPRASPPTPLPPRCTVAHALLAFFPQPWASSSGLPCKALESQPVTEAIRWACYPSKPNRIGNCCPWQLYP